MSIQSQIVLVIIVYVCVCNGFTIERIGSEQNINKYQVAGIIISFHSGGSYDQLLSTVKQKSKQGSVVLTYRAQAIHQKAIYEALTGKLEDGDQRVRQFVREVQKLTQLCASCIVFNWECSSGFSTQNFDNRGVYVFGLLQLIIKRGYMAMFSDFSLKALIRNWDKRILGPNPFIKIGETGSDIRIKFDRQKLINCPSSQLQTVGKLSIGDEIIVQLLPSTIRFAVNNKRQRTDRYELEVLTIASNLKGHQFDMESQINGIRGLPSHVLLSYGRGGKILVSMGHWIQLLKIDTSIQRLYKSTQQLFGQDEAQIVRKQYEERQSIQQKKQYLMKKSIKYVQNQHIGKNYMIEKQKKEKLGNVQL